jgi:hypothetical protein
MCCSYGYKFFHIDNLPIYYSLPTLWKDYVRQWTRFLDSQSISEEFFSQKTINKYYVIKNKERLIALLWSLFHNPFWTLLYVFSRFVIAINFVKNHSERTSLWTIATSTK